MKKITTESKSRESNLAEMERAYAGEIERARQR